MKLTDVMTPEQKKAYLQEKSDKKREQANAKKVLRRFDNLAKEHGFKRKNNWFSRECGNIAHVINFHKYTFGPYFRMHVCIRVLNDSRSTIALNGLENGELHAYQSSFEYSDNEESILACAKSMHSAVINVAEPWFKLNTEEVLVLPASPIIDTGRKGLVEAINGAASEEYIAKSKELLGLA